MRQPSMVRALAAMILAILLHGHVARAQEAGGEPAPLGPNVINSLVARVALYPDPLLALVLQGSTLPLQVVQATRFLEKRARDASLQPDPGWDTSIVGLLNYPTVLVMMNDDLEWTEALGTAVVDQLPDVQAAVQQVRSELQAAGTLASNERQTVTVDEDTIRIQPASPEVIYVPIYEPVPQQAPPRPWQPSLLPWRQRQLLSRRPQRPSPRHRWPMPHRRRPPTRCRRSATRTPMPRSGRTARPSPAVR